MHDRTLYEYAVVRLVPRVEREEFLNIGVLLYCRKQRYAEILYHVDEERCCHLAKDIDYTQINAHLQSMRAVCQGLKEGGSLAQLDQTERFRWLTAYRSTLIQCSAVHPGLCIDAATTHQELFEKLVL
ncbi:DUF3037 domain-containing protein [Sphingobacterium sp. DK4209]|uniref:DUF3037 domain-containing protein n=1 Tax=Sphingobacterium zhuxiongii TaxID=2662364 RepID=A0A5Q0Q7V5_9SPHI|nr:MULTISPECIES: DUF3037 domain-containing protein [unclassified Sphingobacterium]MVZ66900.1 DUF3037 domain-containing protein [Sphingobacterium sp. DK4209]QGA25543.1 DUF3037 domain-containing protein [Sphingobacterium sp. dk4302]